MTGPPPPPPPPPAPEGDVVSAEYELTRQEFTWAFRELQSSAGLGPSGWGWFVGAIGLGLVLAVLNPTWFASALIGLGVLGLAVVAAQRWLVPWMAYRWYPEDRRRQRLELSARGIVSSAPSFRLEQGWPTVRRVVHGPEVSLLVTHEKGEGVIVARRALTRTQLEAFERLIARYAPQAPVEDRRPT